MENDQFDRLGAPVYARGHVRAYLRWLALPESAADELSQTAPVTPSLQPSVRVSRSKIWLERNAMRAVYAVLTISIILPAVWVANERSGLDVWRNGRSLDEVPVALVAQPESAPVSTNDVDAAAAGGKSAAAVEASEGPTPVMASITPFASKSSEAQAPAQAATADRNGWSFEFVGDSWVEIEGPNGRLEYGILRKGESRQFAADALSRVALGNVHAVKLSFAGEPVALDAVTRANVARFKVSSAGEISGDSR